MDFGRFLYLQGWLRWDEYQNVLREQYHRSIEPTHPVDRVGLTTSPLNSFQDLALVRETAFGDVLSAMPCKAAVESRSGRTIPVLVEEWQAWHRDWMEPISVYTMASKFGTQLYTNQLEKKLVGQFLVAAKVRHRGTIIQEHDNVVILEGSSGAYVGLAIAAAFGSVTIYTSNNTLIREWRDNPSIASRCQQFHIIGGQADYDGATKRCQHGAVHGSIAHDQFNLALREHPPVTVVVMTVSGLLPDEGPTVSGPCADLKRDIIENSMAIDMNGERRSVREFVFVADFSKHLPSRRAHYGRALFHAADWKTFRETHQGKISVVTCPPPQLRPFLCVNPSMREVIHRNIPQDILPAADLELVQEYDRTAKRLCTEFGVTHFHEAYAFLLSAGPQEQSDHGFCDHLPNVRTLDEAKKRLYQLLGSDAEQLQVTGRPDGGAFELTCFGPPAIIARLQELARAGQL